MGEYAIRKSDCARIKIGTCEDMLYLRFEDRDKIERDSRSIDANDFSHTIRFRLPFPDEDGLQPGEYKNHERGLRLYRDNDDFADASTANDPGTIQLTHKCGLLVNVPCYHGHQLPVLGDAKTFWNGKSWSLELYQLRPILENGAVHVYPVVRCRFCGHVWRYQWADVLEFIPEPMRSRLAIYAAD